MYFILLLSAVFLNVVFASPIDKNFDSVPAINADMFIAKGDTLVLNPNYPRPRNLLKGKDKLWRGGVVPFYIRPELEQNRQKIYKAMNHISNRTCIRFRPKNHYDKEFVIFTGADRCLAYVGRIGPQHNVPVYLGPGCEELVPATHEILHSLGVHHTQCRSDRDYYIDIHYENMHPGENFNFVKLKDSENQLLVPFDFDSIMLYGPYMGSGNGRPVITPKNPYQKYIDTYAKPGLSELDIKALNKLYKCERYGPQYAYHD